MLQTATSVEKSSNVTLVYAARTDVGCVRVENQDAFSVIEGRGYSLFVVADGMGGVAGGADASAIVVASLRHEFNGGEAPLTIDRLRGVLERANSDIFLVGSGQGDRFGMGTTAVVVGIVGHELLLAHVGDSRAYLLRHGTLTKLTTDHTVVQDLLSAGTLSEEEAIDHPISHVLTRSLGPVSEVAVECARFERFLREGDVLLLCSDGLYQMVPQEELVHILSSYDAEGATARLIARAKERGGLDNVTAIVVAVTATGIPSESYSRAGPLYSVASESSEESALISGRVKPSQEDEQDYTFARIRRFVSAAILIGILLISMTITVLSGFALHATR